MKTKFQQLKQNLSSIHWPSRKELIRDTTVCAVTSVTLATFIALWSHVIELIVNFVISKI